jgi:Tfp pilus assembly protein PilX
MRILTFRNPSSQAGFILPTTIIVLFIVTILAGTAVSLATQTSTSTTRDDNTKAALAAAESGLQVATYRVSQLKLEKTEQCINGSEIKTVESECASSSEPLGNGATFQYWTTKGLTTGQKCGGQTVESKANVVQRCITSEGIVNSTKPGTRLQALIESSVGESLFTVHGILGLEEVLVNGSVKATSVVASNKKIKGEGSAAFEKGFEICPEGKFTPAAGSERNKSGVTIGGVGGMLSNPPLEVTRSQCPIVEEIPVAHPSAAENEDYRIGTTDEFYTEGKSANKFTAATHELNLSSNAKLTLGGAKYYFCKLIAERNGELKIAKGAKIEIFIDDPADGCPTGTGQFTIEGNAHLENPNGASSLLIEMAGKGPLTIANSGSLKANIYAPEAEVILSGSGTLTGGIVGKKVHLEAGSFIFTEESEAFTVGGAGSGGYKRKSWEQCTPGSGATEGC